MMVFERKTEVITSENVEIKPGIYFFKEEDGLELYYRKFVFREKDYDVVRVLCEDGQKSIFYENFSHIAYSAEKCFSGNNKKIDIITEAEFTEKFNEVINYLKDVLCL